MYRMRNIAFLKCIFAAGYIVPPKAASPKPGAKFAARL
jgi:hypothetical protein